MNNSTMHKPIPKTLFNQMINGFMIKIIEINTDDYFLELIIEDLSNQHEISRKLNCELEKAIGMAVLYATQHDYRKYFYHV